MAENKNPIVLRIRNAKHDFNKGLESFERSDYDNALSLFIKALDENVSFNDDLPNKKIYFRIFQCYNRLGKHEQAKNALTKLLSISTPKPFTNFENALLKLEVYFSNLDKENLVDALALLNKNMLLSPKDPDVWYYSGYCKALLGDVKESAKDFKMTILLDREYKNIHSIEIFEKVKKSILS